MTQLTNSLGRTTRRIAILAIPLLVAATGTVAAHSGESYGGMMGGGWSLFGGAMGLWGLLWMGLLIAAPVYIAYSLLDRESSGDDERSLSVLRERYARGEISDDEFDRRREQLERTG
ncbi:SHOCT domain-containing protein [Natronomonas amylolytica]|uniref:SHOCT domain-containing protein n=1 Tax=Natronomonas amylolytica TaxID=3108498 RepID=UPI00300910B3